VRHLLRRWWSRIEAAGNSYFWRSATPVPESLHGLDVRFYACPTDRVHVLRAAIALLAESDSKAFRRLRECARGILIAEIVPLGGIAGCYPPLQLIVLRPEALARSVHFVAMTLSHEAMHVWHGPDAGHLRGERLATLAELATARLIGADSALIDPVRRNLVNVARYVSTEGRRQLALQHLESRPRWERITFRAMQRVEALFTSRKT
jgi:hypothetical protein